MAVEIQAEQDEANILECINLLNAVKTRVDASGTIITAVNSEPNSNALAVGECAWWYDGVDKVKFKARRNATTVLTGELQLS